MTKSDSTPEGGSVRAPLGRRAFVSRLGAFGLGAVGASTLLSACGADRASFTPGGGNGGNGGGGGGGGDLVRVFAPRFADIRTDENNHVAFLIAAMQANNITPRPEPTFPTAAPAWNPQDTQTFAQLSDALENTGTGAYLFAAQNPTLRNTGPVNGSGTEPLVVVAASIDMVEGRHAGFLNAVLNKPLLTDPNTNDTAPPNNGSREVPEPPSQVYSRAAPFVGAINSGNAPAGTTNNSTTTYLNGGPALPDDNTILTTADLSVILNYALFLEYLERNWYNKNVSAVLGI